MNSDTPLCTDGSSESCDSIDHWSMDRGPEPKPTPQSPTTTPQCLSAKSPYAHRQPGIGGWATNSKEQLPDKGQDANPIGFRKFFDNQLLNYKQAAQYLSVSEAYLRKLKARGHVPFVLVGDRAIRFRVCSLDQWIEEREVK